MAIAVWPFVTRYLTAAGMDGSAMIVSARPCQLLLRDRPGRLACHVYNDVHDLEDGLLDDLESHLLSA
jgi:hypothetical protein